MLRHYHRLATQQALAPYFDTQTLSEVIAANLAQDAIGNQLGATPHFHFDGNRIAEGNAFIDAQRDLILQLVFIHGNSRVQRRAFGRLCHAAQDFYSHTNYVALWLAAHGGVESTEPNQIDGLDRQLLTHKNLCSGHFRLWLDPLYYVPIVGSLVKRFYLPADSHEVMHLDSPKRNPHFDYSFQAAVQRTHYEFEQVAAGLVARSGEEALQRFCKM